MEEACRFGVATTSQRRRVAWARRPAGRPVEGRRELGVVAYLACPPAMPAGLSDTLVPYHSALSGLRDVMRRAAAGSLCRLPCLWRCSVASCCGCPLPSPFQVERLVGVTESRSWSVSRVPRSWWILAVKGLPENSLTIYYIHITNIYIYADTQAR